MTRPITDYQKNEKSNLCMGFLRHDVLKKMTMDGIFCYHPLIVIFVEHLYLS